MIRHILLAELNEAATPERIETLKQALASMDCLGRTSFTMGSDLGLRATNMGLAMVADFVDIASFTAYDQDEEHNRIRRDLIAPIVNRLERCQFEY